MDGCNEIVQLRKEKGLEKPISEAVGRPRKYRPCLFGFVPEGRARP